MLACEPNHGWCHEIPCWSCSGGDDEFYGFQFSHFPQRVPRLVRLPENGLGIDEETLSRFRQFGRTATVRKEDRAEGFLQASTCRDTADCSRIATTFSSAS